MSGLVLCCLLAVLGGGLGFLAPPRGSGWSSGAGSTASRGATQRRAAQEEMEVESYYNYLTQQYDWKPKGGATMWEADASGFDFADLLPWSAVESEALAWYEEEAPEWRNGFLTPNTEDEIRRRFRVLAEAAGSEEAGLVAFKKNQGIICINERITKAALAALLANLGKEKTAEVVMKNPGILAIRATGLQGASLQVTVLFAEVINFVTGPGKYLVIAFQLAFAISIGKALFDVVNLAIGRSSGGS